MSWVETTIYYSPYLIQFLFLLLFVTKNKNLIRFIDLDYEKSTFTILSMIVLSVVLFCNISYSYYTNNLLIYYIIQTLVYYYILINNFNIKDSISLALLISFASSFYWEIPIHLIVLFNGESIRNILIQSMHFATLPFIFNRIVIIDKFKFYRRILYGLIIADILAILSLLIINNHYNYFNMISRLCCAFMVITGFLMNIKRKDLTMFENEN